MNFKRSNEPVVWSMFGAGGMAAAFLLPAIIIAIGILFPLNLLGDEALSFQRVLAFITHPIGKLCWLTVIIFPLWHAMHRIYHGLHDFKVGAGQFFFALCYGFAFVVSVAATFIAFSI